MQMSKRKEEEKKMNQGGKTLLDGQNLTMHKSRKEHQRHTNTTTWLTTSKTSEKRNIEME